jgi:hypothetical protein
MRTGEGGSYSSIAKASSNLRPAAGREKDSHRRVLGSLPREQVTQWRQVDVVIGVEVADHDGAEPAGIVRACQPADDAGSTVEKDGRTGRLHQKPRSWRIGLGPRGPRTDDRQTHGRKPIGDGMRQSWGPWRASVSDL